MAKTNPFFDVDVSKFTDVSKLISEFKLPGVDVASALASQQKNIQALTAANQLAFEGFQAVARRQSEILRQSIEQTTAIVTELLAAGSPEDKVAKQAELVKSAFEKALTNTRELAELVTKSNSEAADVINKRVSESLEELKAAVAKAKSVAK
jgi:phasin family protein